MGSRRRTWTAIAILLWGLAIGPFAGGASAATTTHLAQVVGDGQPASCTSAALVNAVSAGGLITFACGPQPVTITMTRTARVPKTDRRVVIDGGGLVTLSGAGERQILFSDTCQGTWSTDDCVDQPYPQITLRRITLTDGYAAARQNFHCTQNIPVCWYGGVDGGGAVYVEGGRFSADHVRFTDNRCYADGPDLGGGAIRALAQYRDEPVRLSHDTFNGNRCSNGGAISSISTSWDVANCTFTDNAAVGWGANPAAPGTPGGGSGGAIYLDGKNDNQLITGSVMTGNTAREGGGAIFDTVDSGHGSLRIDHSTLTGNTSGEFQTQPGTYYLLDGAHAAPRLAGTTDR